MESRPREKTAPVKPASLNRNNRDMIDSTAHNPIRSQEWSQWERQQFMNRGRHKRRTSAELDWCCGVPRSGEVESLLAPGLPNIDLYVVSGLNLGFHERRARGRDLAALYGVPHDPNGALWAS